MYLLKKDIDNARKVNVSKHRDLLLLTVELLHHHSVHEHTAPHPHPLKAHPGIHGNEPADRWATTVSKGDATPDYTCPADTEQYHTSPRVAAPN